MSAFPPAKLGAERKWRRPRTQVVLCLSCPPFAGRLSGATDFEIAIMRNAVRIKLCYRMLSTTTLLRHSPSPCYCPIVIIIHAWIITAWITFQRGPPEIVNCCVAVIHVCHLQLSRRTQGRGAGLASRFKFPIPLCYCVSNRSRKYYSKDRSSGFRLSMHRCRISPSRMVGVFCQIIILEITPSHNDPGDREQGLGRRGAMAMQGQTNRLSADVIWRMRLFRDDPLRVPRFRSCLICPWPPSNSTLCNVEVSKLFWM